MKTRGIAMTAANAEACALGTKTETRRLINGQLDPEEYVITYVHSVDGTRRYCWTDETDPLGCQGSWHPVPLQPGDFIYIKEPYRLDERWDDLTPSGVVFVMDYRRINGDDCKSVPVTAPQYEACRNRIDGEFTPGRYRHARFMPKEFARTWGRVVEVKAERVQEITEEAAIREGMDWNGKREPGFPGWRVPGRGGGRTYHNTPTEAYAEVWDSIHGPGSWERNDWVWVIRWEKCERPEDI